MEWKVIIGHELYGDLREIIIKADFMDEVREAVKDSLLRFESIIEIKPRV